MFAVAFNSSDAQMMNKSKWYTRFFFSASLLPYTHTNTRVFDRHNNAGIAEISDIINEEVWG